MGTSANFPCPHLDAPETSERLKHACPMTADTFSIPTEEAVSSIRITNRDIGSCTPFARSVDGARQPLHQDFLFRISRLMLSMAAVGFSSLGQASMQFMI